eukprot:TRINITY_DN3000_c0_g1_i3.p1 TRINITY_DN3000_c0_g1~~TRINITY_DN3000_c0_g1_i3.p1  ORF type:complete len:176 (-),score=17.44 TRINITY_DN3000_c0_g1_i3:154-612(-)
MSEKLKAENARLTEENLRRDKELKRISVNSALMIQELAAVKTQLTQAKDAEETWKIETHNRIAYTSFQINDLALFVKNEKGYYEAFNIGAPHRYLSEESKLSASQTSTLHDRVVGLILLIEKCKAGKAKAGNPYDLPNGTVFYKLMVELKSS